MKFIQRMKNLWRIAATYDSTVGSLRMSLDHTRDIMKQRTTVHADLSPHMKSPHQIITIGRYKNKDYIQVYSVTGESFSYMVGMLRDMRRHGEVGIIDAPHGSECFIREDIMR